MLRALPLVLATLFACSEPDHRFDDVRVVCTYDDTAVGWFDPAPNGIVPNDLLEVAEGEHVARGVWIEEAREVQVDLSVERRGESATYRENTGGGCGSYLAMEVAVTLSTSDGALDEALQVQAVDAALGEPALALSHVLAPSEIGGTYRPTADAGELRGLRIALTFRAAGPSGRLAVMTEGTDGDVAWASEDDALEISPSRS